MDDLEKPPRKRARLDQTSFTTPVSPPARSTKAPPTYHQIIDLSDDAIETKRARGASPVVQAKPNNNGNPTTIPSPFKLTWIRDLPDQLNVDTIKLSDILGDPLISELWEFNYLHDLDFLMRHLDSDTRDLVKVHVVHGHWKRESPSRMMMEEQASQYKNVSLITAHMPEPYGTHHTKMMVLFRHDDTAQIVVHTANMIEQDWTNLTQAVWSSPPLPLLSNSSSTESHLGSGAAFKIDFLNYLQAYNVRGPKTRALIQQLEKFDFSSIRGTLIASVPGRHSQHSNDSPTSFGWPALKNTLSQIPSTDGGRIVAQVSSIATLGVTNAWLHGTLFAALRSSSNNAKKPSHAIIFPSADEIRRCLDGYAAGSSIHVKTQSAQAAKQMQYIKPLLHHWDGSGVKTPVNIEHHAGRKQAAPHIKTYIRFQPGPGQKRIDWALVTSANLSQQAWGAATNTAGDVRVSSYELGVLVWPGLYDRGDGAEMVPVFKKDCPDIGGEAKVVVEEDIRAARLRRFDKPSEVKIEEVKPKPNEKITVGFRMPYDLPLTKYDADEIPWVATASHEIPDWQGRTCNMTGPQDS